MKRDAGVRTTPVTGLALPNGNTLQYSPEATRARLITTV